MVEYEDDEGGWGEAGDMEEDEGWNGNEGSHWSAVDVLPVSDDKGFRCVESKEVSKKVMERVEEMQDLYAMDLN